MLICLQVLPVKTNCSSCLRRQPPVAEQGESVWIRGLVGPGWAPGCPVLLASWVLPELSKRHLSVSKEDDRARPGSWPHRCWDWYEDPNPQRHWLWLAHLIVRQFSPLLCGLQVAKEQPGISRYWARHGHVLLYARRQLGYQDSSAQFWTLFIYKNLLKFSDCQLQLEEFQKRGKSWVTLQRKIAQSKGVKSTLCWSLKEPGSILWKYIWLPTVRWYSCKHGWRLAAKDTKAGAGKRRRQTGAHTGWHSLFCLPLLKHSLPSVESPHCLFTHGTEQARSDPSLCHHCMCSKSSYLSGWMQSRNLHI